LTGGSHAASGEERPMAFGGILIIVFGLVCLYLVVRMFR
jgi:hypothetical protein